MSISRATGPHPTPSPAPRREAGAGDELQAPPENRSLRDHRLQRPVLAAPLAPRAFGVDHPAKRLAPVPPLSPATFDYVERRQPAYLAVVPVEPVPLRGPRLLARGGGSSWGSVLEPLVRDTAMAPNKLPLGQLEWMIERLLATYTRHPLPQFILHWAPDEADRADAVAVVSVLVGHRAERLVQCVELAAAALDALEHRSLQLAAVSARALLEVAVVGHRDHGALLDIWRPVHGCAGDVRAATSGRGLLWDQLVAARHSTRVDEWRTAHGAPVALNIVTHLKKLAEAGLEHTSTYSWLCEATHPNVESQGVLWRTAPPDRHGRPRVAFEPSGSESPVRLAVVDAVLFSLKTIVPYCDDLWWIAAETSCAWNLASPDDAVELGLPMPTSRNELCCCGSGMKTKRCDHPGPPLPSEEWDEKSLRGG